MRAQSQAGAWLTDHGLRDAIFSTRRDAVQAFALAHAHEPFAVVPGTPTVDDATPEVKTDTTMATDSFGVNVPKQCDAYTQLPVRKVDILWVVDSSGSMAPKQARLASNFQGFINQLVTANPPIDFHIAVTSTDTEPLHEPGERAQNRGPLAPRVLPAAVT